MKNIIFLEIHKIKNYRTFWVLAILFLVIQGVLCSSWQAYINYLAEHSNNKTILKLVENFALYHFRDIWHNLTYVAGFFKFILAVFVITSICNELSYRTLRQNIIDGLSRFDFLMSKMSLVFMLSLASSVFLFLQGSVLGLIYTKPADYHYFFNDAEFLISFFFESMFFYTFALLIGLLIKRTGLSMILLFVYVYIAEPVIALNIPDKMQWLKNLMPVYAMNNLNEVPFKKYAMMTTKEYVALTDVLIVSAYILIFVGISYLVLRKRDL